ncbi:MAG: hypothetical protein K2M44_00555 [Clostridia bacterium]|nr:hypothetical protein [Clostridia bacterium]
MEICEITLDSKQYALLKSMLSCDRRADLIRKIPINAKELFYDMTHEIYSPVIDGWSTLEIVLKESSDTLNLLRFMTKQIFPSDENYFVKQLGRKWANFRLKKDCALIIYKNGTSLINVNLADDLCNK